jgi:ComF family protein
MQIIAPHYCYSCAKVGSVLCLDCKYDINEDSFDACIICLVPSSVGICKTCRTSFSRAWFVGERQESLREVIDDLKFKRVKCSATSLAELLDMRLPELPQTTVIVPVPTIRSHVRKRGYDQVALIAEQLASLRSLPVTSIIERHHSNVQLGKSKRERMQQMSTAFRCTALVNSRTTYLIIDDVVTTSATLRYCAEALLQ